MLLFLVACSDYELDVVDPITQPNNRGSTPAPSSDWMQTPLFDVQTGEQVRVADYADEVLFVELFATWCSACVEQQREVQSLNLTHLAINIDSEDEQEVVSYVDEHRFSGVYAVASAQYVDELIEVFGTGIANIPSAPVILVCADQEAHLLPRRLLRAAELQEFVDARC